MPFAVVRRFVADLPGRPSIVAVDGRSSNGKTTVSGRLAAAFPGATVMHTDDIAWFHAVLAWDDLLVDGVLRPVRNGPPVTFRPPQWEIRGRTGSIDVPPSCPLLIVEGVASGRGSLASWYDAMIWVESDLDLVDRRNDVRVATGEISPGGHASWLAEEIPSRAGRAQVGACGSGGERVRDDPARPGDRGGDRVTRFGAAPDGCLRHTVSRPDRIGSPYLRSWETYDDDTGRTKRTDVASWVPSAIGTRTTSARAGTRRDSIGVTTTGPIAVRMRGSIERLPQGPVRPSAGHRGTGRGPVGPGSSGRCRRPQCNRRRSR